MLNHCHGMAVLFWSCVRKLLYACAIHMCCSFVYRSIFPSAETLGVGMSCSRGLSFNPAKKQDWEWVLGIIGDALIGSSGCVPNNL